VPRSNTIKDFIIVLLERANRPLSTAEIYEAFDEAGYHLTTSSIRGRLNTLTYEGRILRVGHATYAALSSGLFNLLVSANGKAWDDGSATTDRSRFLEYTDKKIIALFESLSPPALRALGAMPTLFAYEAGVDRPARVGRLKDIHVAQSSINIWFEFESGWPPIEPNLFRQMRVELGFGKNEEFRTHWAIKEIDLASTLVRFGIQPTALSEAETPPIEPPPGPGPQYTSINGKLSEIVSAPSPEEAARQTQLHSRLREETLALVTNLERVGNRYPELLNSTKRYSELLNASSDALDVTGLWCVGGSLAQYAASYRSQNIARTLSEPLEPQLEAQLQSIVRQHGALIMGFKEGSDLVHRADEFLVDIGRLKGIEQPGNVLLAELTDNQELVDDRTRALHRPVRDSVLEFGWSGSRIGYSAYVIVRNCVRAIIKLTVGENPNVGAILGILAGGSALIGDPNAEFIRAAIPVLHQYGSQLLSFFNHSPEMRSYVEWALNILESDHQSRNPQKSN
jgi:hypothetical protein